MGQFDCGGAGWVTIRGLIAIVRSMSESTKWVVGEGTGGKFWVCHLLESGRTGNGRIQFDTREAAQHCIDSGDVDRELAIIDEMERRKRK